MTEQELIAAMTEKIRCEIPEVLQEIGKIAAFEKLEENMIVDIDSKFQKGGHC